MHYLLFALRHLYPTVALRTPLKNLSWVTGHAHQEQIPPLEFEVEADARFEWPDLIRPAANIPLASPVLRKILDGCGADNITYYPARITNTTTGEQRHYLAANILGIVSAMDREHSVFNPFMGNSLLVQSVSKLVLDPMRCDPFMIFRLKEYDLLVIVEQAVKVAIENSRLAGIAFQLPEEWDGFRT